MRLTKLSRQEWEEWKGSPVTEALRDAMGALIEREREAAQAAYWAGKPISEENRISLMRAVAWHEDVFSSSYEDAVASFGLEVQE